MNNDQTVRVIHQSYNQTGKKVLLFINTFTAIVDLSRSNFSVARAPLKERSTRDWKVRSTKVDAGDFKRELLSPWVFK